MKRVLIFFGIPDTFSQRSILMQIKENELMEANNCQ